MSLLKGQLLQNLQDSLTALKGGRIPPPGSMPSFEEIKEILGFNSYYEEEKRYATSKYQLYADREGSNAYSIQRVRDDSEQRGQSPQDPVVEVITPDVYTKYGADGSRDPFSGIWSQTLRIKITGRDGFEKLDVRVPAGFLEGITNIVPALGGVNLKALLDDAAEEVGGKVVFGRNADGIAEVASRKLVDSHHSLKPSLESSSFRKYFRNKYKLIKP
ncbi:hypothetical protein GOBAR_AA33101 [Gossypium barbadense]|uniref:Uncharacterized protein n=1 Tax=Gossypium barbadense TaxID=3634 RepID=A0A2P5W936_GOSBA|nr:hypothetical protein GOBAR_AA33101 [Gossypium barbadense]